MKYPRLTDEQWTLVLENRGLAYKAMNMRRIPMELQEEVYSEVCLPSMMRSAKTFNPAVAKYTTYAMFLLFKNLSMRRPEMKRVFNPRSTPFSQFGADDDAIKIDKPSPDWPPSFDVTKTLDVLMAGLSVQERAMLWLHCAEGKTLKETSELVGGVTQQGVQQVCRKVILALKSRAKWKNIANPL